MEKYQIHFWEAQSYHNFKKTASKKKEKVYVAKTFSGKH